VRAKGLAVLLLVALAGGALAVLRWPSTAPALDCPPSEQHLDDAGVVRCGPGAPLSAPQLLAAGGKLDLNRASAEELAAIAGIGPKLAQALVDARAKDGGFHDWSEVDRVSGVGAAKLKALQDAADIR
jgi:competence protein ComEA